MVSNWVKSNPQIHVGDDLVLYNDGAGDDGMDDDNYDYAMVSGEVSVIDYANAQCYKLSLAQK